MKKILLLLGVVMLGQAKAQVTSSQIGAILVPKYAGATKASTGDTTRTPIIFRVRINGLKPNEKYKYITKGLIPVPMHPKKELKRGYNPAKLIAQ